jgi:hypothetical protein
VPEAEKEAIQDAVDKTQASKTGRIGTLDGGEPEGPSKTVATILSRKLTQQAFCPKQPPRSPS